jgi:lipid-A-disaccharide synthase
MHLFFSVGEPSGDLHGANLVRELRHLEPALKAAGFGGPRMAAAGCELLEDMTELAVMGLFPVLAKLPRFFELRDRAASYLRDERPDAVVLIDYPGFNWHIARAAKELDIPVFYYGLPQLWAWGEWRVRKVRELVDHALCKLPFEEPWFRERGCRATYVGHPYFDELAGHRLDHPFLDRLAFQRGRLVTILPGSRTQEVKNNLPQLLRAAGHVQREVGGVRLAIASYNERQAVLARRIVERAGLKIDVYVGRTPELILSAEVCLATSGSVSLELLWHARPSVILYRVPWWTYAVVRQLVKAKYITLVNLLADRELMPEYPTCGDRSTEIAQHAIQWLTSEPARRRIIADLTALRDLVAQGGASRTAAEYIARQLAVNEPIALPVPAATAPAAYRKAS